MDAALIQEFTTKDNSIGNQEAMSLLICRFLGQSRGGIVGHMMNLIGQESEKTPWKNMGRDTGRGVGLSSRKRRTKKAGLLDRTFQERQSAPRLQRSAALVLLSMCLGDLVSQSREFLVFSMQN